MEEQKTDHNRNDKDTLIYCPHCGEKLYSGSGKKAAWGEQPMRNSTGCLLIILVTVALFLLSVIMWVNP